MSPTEHSEFETSFPEEERLTFRGGGPGILNSVWFGAETGVGVILLVGLSVGLGIPIPVLIEPEYKIAQFFLIPPDRKLFLKYH